MTRSFEFTFDGIKSIPDVDKAMASKKPTIGYQKVLDAKAEIDKMAKKDGIDLTAAVVKTRDWLSEQIREVKSVLFSIRGKMAALKMAKLLTGDNFEGFELDSDNQFKYTSNGMTLYMNMDKVKEFF